MTIDIEKLKVDESLWPEGATHFNYMISRFLRYQNGAWDLWDNVGPEAPWWNPANASVADHCIPRPEPRQVEWDGAGYPPPGFRWEFRIKGEPWEGRTCKVLGYNAVENELWAHLDGNDSSNIYELKKFEFRLSPTKEQREREDAVAAALELDRYPNGEAAGGLMSRRDFCEKLYDCGLLRSKAK